jgi:hypothetical protein
MDTAHNKKQESPVREKLPDERKGKTFKLVLGVDEPVEDVVRQMLEDGEVPAPTKIKAFMTANMYEDGRLGEIFITPDKEGTLLKGLLDGFATMASISLQYGVPLHVIVKKFMNTRFGPQGMTNSRSVPIASSMLDFIVRKLALEHLPEEHCQELGIINHRKLIPDVDQEQDNEQGAHDEQREGRPGWAGEEGFEEQEGWEWEQEAGCWAYVNRTAKAFVGDDAAAQVGAGDCEA